MRCTRTFASISSVSLASFFPTPTGIEIWRHLAQLVKSYMVTCRTAPTNNATVGDLPTFVEAFEFRRNLIIWASAVIQAVFFQRHYYCTALVLSPMHSWFDDQATQSSASHASHKADIRIHHTHQIEADPSPDSAHITIRRKTSPFCHRHDGVGSTPRPK